MPSAVFFASWVNTTIVAMFSFGFSSRLSRMVWLKRALGNCMNYSGLLLLLPMIIIVWLLWFHSEFFLPSQLKKSMSCMYFGIQWVWKKIGEENRRIVICPLASSLWEHPSKYPWHRRTFSAYSWCMQEVTLLLCVSAF